MEYKKSKNGRYNLGGGWEALIIKTLPDENGNDLEVILYYNGEIFTGITNKTKFKEITEAINVYKNILIPSFILNAEANADGIGIKDIDYLKTETMMIKFSDKWLYENRHNVFFGGVIDLIKALDDFGYEMPDPDDYVVKGKLVEFYKSVDNINKVMLKRLRRIGFGPDHNMSNFHDQERSLFTKDPSCDNIIATRYPWTPAYRMIYSAKVFGRVSNGDFIKNQDMSEYSVMYPDHYEAMLELERDLKVVHDKVLKVYKKTGFADSAEMFEGLIDEDREALVEEWRGKQPVGYKQFVKEYEEYLEEQKKYREE